MRKPPPSPPVGSRVSENARSAPCASDKSSVKRSGKLTQLTYVRIGNFTQTSLHARALVSNRGMATNGSARKLKRKQVQLIANGDLRLSANQVCWPAQKAMEEELGRAVAAAGYELVRAHPYKPEQKHGFIQSQKEGMEVFRDGVDPDAPIIVAEAVW